MGISAFFAKYGLTVNGALLVANASTQRVGVNTASPIVTFVVAANDAVALPVGNTGQRPTLTVGYIRYNSDTNTFEGANNSAWGAIGGGVSVAGSNGFIQYNNSSALGATSNLQIVNNNILQVPIIQGLSGVSLGIGAANSGDVNKPFINFNAVNNSAQVFGNTSVTIATFDPSGFSVQKQRIQQLGSLSTVTPDCSNGNIIQFTLSANTTVNAPTNLQPGFYTFIVNNNTFAITTWNSTYKWPGATAPQSTTTGTDVFSFVSNGSVMYGSMVPNLG